MLYNITILAIFNHFLLGALLLFAPRTNNLPNKLLSGQLICMGILHTTSMFVFWPNLKVLHYTLGLDYAVGTLVGPFIYLYLYSIIRGYIPKGFKLLIIFSAPIVFFIIYAGVQIVQAIQKVNLIEFNSEKYKLAVYIADSAVLLLTFTFILIAYHLYRNAINQAKQRRRIQTKWLKTYFVATLSFFICITPMAIIKNGNTAGMYMSVVSLVYFGILVWQSLSSSKIFGNNYLKSENGNGVYSKELTAIIEKIERENLFVRENFSLEMLSEMVNLPKAQLSSILNSEMQMSFVELANSYRIVAAKQKLQDPAFENYTIEAIGKESGFQSRATFYEVFKKHTGQTPSEYKQQIRIATN